jgi:hypothetical protein
MSINELFIKQI